MALPDGRVVALGGLTHGASTDAILGGLPSRLRRIGTLPVATHDAAAVAVGGRVELFGGGQSTSSAAVARIDAATGAATALHPLDEPLSDLGAAVVGGRTYLVGGYTGTRFAARRPARSASATGRRPSLACPREPATRA